MNFGVQGLALSKGLRKGKDMPDSKNLKWSNDFARDTRAEEGKTEAAVKAETPAANDAMPAANDSDGWQQYRQWISKAPAPRGRRAGIDPALYSWKGYRNWTEQVRRNWSPDEDDSE